MGDGGITWFYDCNDQPDHIEMRGRDNLRKAYHWQGLPPREWFITTALLYDKVILPIKWLTSPWFAEEDFPPSPPTAEHPRGEDLAGYYLEMMRDYNSLDFVEDFCSAVITPTVYPRSPRSETVIASLNPNVDLYVDEPLQQHGGLPFVVEAHGSFKPSLITTIQVLVPLDPDHVKIPQIVDFRAANELRRVHFQSSAAELVKSFGDSSTEAEMRRLWCLCDQSLREEFQKIEQIYIHTRIEAITKTLPTVGAPPAIIGVVGSMLASGFMESTLVVSAGLAASIALSIPQLLIAREKADITVNDSKWAYLWHMKHSLLA